MAAKLKINQQKETDNSVDYMRSTPTRNSRMTKYTVRIGEDYDNHEKQPWRLQSEKHPSHVCFRPRSAEFLTEMSKGGNPVLSSWRRISHPDIKETLDDPDKMQELADAWAEEQQRIAKSKQLDDEYAENLPKSLDAPKCLKRSVALLMSRQIVHSTLSILCVMVWWVNFNRRCLTSWQIKAILNYDEDVADAQEEGEVAGRIKGHRKLRKNKNGEDLHLWMVRTNQEGQARYGYLRHRKYGMIEQVVK